MNQTTSLTPTNIMIPSAIGTALQTAHGTVPYGMTNDYMFRAVLQSNNQALRGLICSLLHLSEADIDTVEITNPIILGESVKNKEFRLDVNVILNNRTLINLEMQIANKLNWKNRSVMYLCRSFDQLSHGQNYEQAKSVIHIGFLDYTLFEQFPEFYASYKLINVKNHQIYSDSLTLNVVDLSRIDLATEEDTHYHIHDWAALFKATTWEDIKMLASKNEYLSEAAETIFRLNTDEQIRKQCRDREEYYQDMQNYERELSDRERTILSYQTAISERERVIADYQETISERERAIADYQETISERERAIADYQETISERERAIADYQETISERERAIADYQETISERERAIAEKEARIQQLLSEIERLKIQK